MNAEELVDVTFVTVGDLVIEVGIYSSSVYEFVYRALTPPGSCWTTLDEAVNEVAPSPDTYPMLIVAEAVPNGVPVDIQIAFTINGVVKQTPYSESLFAGSYTIVLPATTIFNGTTHTLLGNNEFTISHPENAQSYSKASYFAELPPPPIRVRFNTSLWGKIDWGEGPQDYGSILISSGDRVDVAATPDAGGVFLNWRKNDVYAGTQNPRYFIITEDETKIVTVFKEKTGFQLSPLLILAILGLGGFLLLRGRGPTVVIRKNS